MKTALAVPESKIPNPKSQILVLALIGLLLAELPLLLAWCCGPRELQGLGTFWFINDFAQYESAMDQGARAMGWLVENRFTPEPHQPALIFPFYVALGKLAATGGVPLEVVYRTTELLARGALVGGLAAFSVWALGPGRQALVGFVLALFGMGLGAPVAIVGALLGLEGVYTGNGSYEVNTFGLLFSAPHAALAMALTLAMVMTFDQFVSGDTLAVGRACVPARARAGTEARPTGPPHRWYPRPRSLAALGASALGVALLHPFHLPVALLALALDGGLRMRESIGVRRVAAGLGVPLLLAAPLATYAAVTFNLDPFWGATYGAQNLLPTPHPWELPIEYGVLLLLAVPGTACALRKPSSRRRLLLLWVGALLLAMYLPVPYQRRLSFGLQPALALLATLGLWECRQWLSLAGREGLSRWLQPATIALALITTATVAMGILASALRDEPMRPYRANAGEAQAAEWLSGVVRSDQVVLAGWETSNYLAGRVPARMVGGHPVATLHAEQRRRELSAFFQAEEPERRRVVGQYGVDFVFFGPRERALGRLDGAPWLTAVYEGDNVAIYAVNSL